MKPKKLLQLLDEARRLARDEGYHAALLKQAGTRRDDGSCALPCPRLQEESFRASSLESDVARLMAECDQSRAELLTVRAELVAVAEARDDYAARYEEAMLKGLQIIALAESAERDRDRLQLENADLCKLLADARGERDAAEERVRQLDADAANLRAGIDDAKGGSELRRLARLGRSVEAMPSMCLIMRMCTGLEWAITLPSGRKFLHCTAQEALDAGGIVADYTDTDEVAAALRAEEAAASGKDGY